MKGIYLLLVTLLFSFCIKAQDVPPGRFTIEVPKSAVKVSKEGYIKQDSMFKHRHYQPKYDQDFLFNNAYINNGILIRYFDMYNTTDNRTLYDIKLEMYGMHEHGGENPSSKLRYSKIEIIKGMPILIYEYKRDNEVTVNFLADPGSTHIFFHGQMFFKAGKSKKAEKILYQMLNTIQYIPNKN